MVGGEQHAYDTARPYFDMMGARVVRLGASGAGTAMKLINQLLVGVHTVAAAEAFALANWAGVDLQVAAEILHVSWGASQMIDRNAPVTHAQAFADSRTPVRTLHKDLDIITALADEAQLTLPLGIEAHKVSMNRVRMGRRGRAHGPPQNSGNEPGRSGISAPPGPAGLVVVVSNLS